MTATATKRTRSRKVSRGSRFVSSTATATIGPNSPMAPTDRTDGPNFVCSTPASRRIGSRVPSAVVVRHSATTTWSRTRPVEWSTSPTPNARRSETPQDPTARPRCPRRIVVISSSVPARNIRYVSPKSDSAETMAFGFTKLSTKGPSMMPSRISITTSGTGTKRRSPSAMIGARTAATPMSTSVGMALVIMRRQLALWPPAVARLATSRPHATRSASGNE